MVSGIFSAPKCLNISYLVRYTKRGKQDERLSLALVFLGVVVRVACREQRGNVRRNEMKCHLKLKMTKSEKDLSQFLKIVG